MTTMSTTTKIIPTTTTTIRTKRTITTQWTTRTGKRRRRRRNNQIENRNLIRGFNDPGFDLFPDSVRHFGAPFWPFWIQQALGCSGRCSIAGPERVPPAPLGWYCLQPNDWLIAGVQFFWRSTYNFSISVPVKHQTSF